MFSEMIWFVWLAELAATLGSLRHKREGSISRNDSLRRVSRMIADPAFRSG